MNKAFAIPPQSPDHLTSINVLRKRFQTLIGRKFPLTGKSRTDGSNVRKMVAEVLDTYDLVSSGVEGSYEIVPPKKKGIPKITREFIDTYIVTSGTNYNLQVWNRIPSSDSLLIKYDTGESLKCTDVRFVFVKIEKEVVSGISILSTKYIIENFGKFGVPTIKHQLLISNKIRQNIYISKNKLCFYSDSHRFSQYTQLSYKKPTAKITDAPEKGKLFSLALIKELIINDLLGFKIPSNSTKNRGQELERKVAELLGYTINENDLLYGGFPDIPNQLLEVKIQDTQTVDLGKFSPEKEELVNTELNLTTFDARYLIALTDPKTETIKAIILSPGEKLGELFSYVSDQSYKCQRGIPMSFFEQYKDEVVFDPDPLNVVSQENFLF